jgi:hypothetical protein
MSDLKGIVKAVWADVSDELAAELSQSLGDSVVELRKLTQQAKTPEERMVLSIFAQAVAVYGAAGIAKARKAVDDLLSGKNARLEFVDTRTKSDAIALLQRAEAARRSQLRGYAATAGDAVAVVLAKMLQGMLVL